MKKNRILILSTALLVSSKVSFAADTGSCGKNCVYNYDPTTQTLTYIGTGENGSGIINQTSDYGLSGTVKNAIISEGITSINGAAIQNIGTSDGKLIIPSTLNNFGVAATQKLGFGIVEINSSNLNFERNSLRFKNDANPTIIISDNAEINFNDNTFYHDVRGYEYPTSLNITCKGNPDVCLSKFGNSLNNMNGSVTADYYEERDSDGNLILKYNDNGYEKYDDQGNILAKYDLKGNLLQSRVYNADGSVLIYDKNGKIVGIQGKKILTVEEASALVNNNKNTFSIRYR